MDRVLLLDLKDSPKVNAEEAPVFAKGRRQNPQDGLLPDDPQLSFVGLDTAIRH
jgi:hypothetical protein